MPLGLNALFITYLKSTFSILIIRGNSNFSSAINIWEIKDGSTSTLHYYMLNQMSFSQFPICQRIFKISGNNLGCCCFFPCDVAFNIAIHFFRFHPPSSILFILMASIVEVKFEFPICMSLCFYFFLNIIL